MSMPDPFSVPLKDEEFVELGELLAAMPAPFDGSRPHGRLSNSNRASTATHYTERMDAVHPGRRRSNGSCAS